MEVEIGVVTHYYNHLNVAVLKLNQGLNLGDRIHILGHSTDFIEKVTSMEVNHHAVGVVDPGRCGDQGHRARPRARPGLACC
jgi:putative protease